MEWFGSPLETAEEADVLAVLTEWNEFRAVDLRALRQAMRGNVLVDLRNVYHPQLAKDAGFLYRGVGRGSPRPEKSQASDSLSTEAGVGLRVINA